MIFNTSRSTFLYRASQILNFFSTAISLLTEQFVLPMGDEQPGQWGEFLSCLQIAFLPCLSCLQEQGENSPPDWSDESLSMILSRFNDPADSLRLDSFTVTSGTTHLQISMPSLGFEPRPNGTAVSVTNHRTG
ncbi:hypothetical protein TNCV_1847411 [Trichonephila clavipes]|nr:hypothetical protein TNCV_1847411 [Trichonephila clavipes]